MIAELGGSRAADLFRVLCGPGPFARVTSAMFAQLLRDLAAADLVVQTADGSLLPGEVGERLINHYSFFAAFQTDEEYRLVADGKTLGSIPINFPLIVGNLLIFAGERWIILAIDPLAKVIELKPASGGRPPDWESLGPPLADGIRQKMREIYLAETVPPYLDTQAKENLAVGRSHFRSLQLDRTPLIQTGTGTAIIPWRGDIIMNTIGCLLATKGIKFDHRGVLLHCAASPTVIRAAADEISRGPRPNPVDLAAIVKNKSAEKYDHFLGETLLNEEYAQRSLDLDAVWENLTVMLPPGS